MHCVMKIKVIIFAVLVTQVSASFFDVFQGAVLSIQTSFGKLVSDVVTDVKETVDCTILAVEHVLALSDDATDRYYERCKGYTDPDIAPSNSGATTATPQLQVSVQILNDDLKKTLPAEINDKVNETVSKILDDYSVKSKLEKVEDVLAMETERLGEVSVIVKDELHKLLSEVNSDLKTMKQDDSALSIETVLDKVKILQDIEHNAKNSSEAKQIHQIIDEVLLKLDEIEATETAENVKLEEILKDMELRSNSSFTELEKQIERNDEESEYINDIKSKIEAEKDITSHLRTEDPKNISSTLNYTQKELLSRGYEPRTLDDTSIFNTEPPTDNISIPDLTTTTDSAHMHIINNADLTVVPNKYVGGRIIEEPIIINGDHVNLSRDLSTSNITSMSPESEFSTTESPTSISIDEPKSDPINGYKSTYTNIYTSTNISTKITNDDLLLEPLSKESYYTNLEYPMTFVENKRYNQSSNIVADPKASTNQTLSTQAYIKEQSNDVSETRYNNTIYLGDPITSEPLIPTDIHEDFKMEPESPTNFKSSYHSTTGPPFIDTTAKSKAFNLDSSIPITKLDNTKVTTNSSAPEVLSEDESNTNDAPSTLKSSKSLVTKMSRIESKSKISTDASTTPKILADSSTILNIPTDSAKSLNIPANSYTTTTLKIPTDLSATDNRHANSSTLLNIPPDSSTIQSLPAYSSIPTMVKDTGKSKIEPTSAYQNMTLPISEQNVENSSSAKPIPSSEIMNELVVDHSKIDASNELHNMSTATDANFIVSIYDPTNTNAQLIHHTNEPSETHLNDKTIYFSEPVMRTQPIIPIEVNKDIQMPYESGEDLKRLHFTPLLDETMKTIASDSESSIISKISNEEPQLQETVPSIEKLDSTKINKGNIVITTAPPVDSQKKMDISAKLSLDYDTFFKRATKNTPLHRKAVKEARKLIEDSKYTDLIMNSILKHKKSERSVFNYQAPPNFT